MQERRIKELMVTKNKRRHQKILISILACFIALLTVNELTLPAQTLEKAEPDCGYEEHQHTEECYEDVLICGQDENHEHTEECYQIQEKLICEKTENPEGHIHDESCYDENGTLICEEEEAHIHSEECYEEETILICGQDENHVHTEECYEKKLICEKEEHQHTEECFSDSEDTPVTDGEPDGDNSTEGEKEVVEESAEEWEKTLPDTLTGVWAEDLIAVAQSQLGYQESADNYIVNEDGTVSGYTRYGAWYGLPYDEWCAMFVSFCLNYAGIPAEVFPRESSVARWAELLGSDEIGLFIAASETESGESSYQPRPGDLIFFDRNQDGAADHVGIAAEISEEKTITVIEGNADDQVKSIVYSLADELIYGYAALPDNSEAIMTLDSDYTYTSEEAFYLWLSYLDGPHDESSEKIIGYSDIAGNNDNPSIKDVLSYQDGAAEYFLIPISYFEVYKEKDASIDLENITENESCPFFYAPDAYKSMENLTRASYVQVTIKDPDSGEEKNEWYVRVQDSTIPVLSPHRSNIYYYPPLQTITDAVNHPGSVINLFDYWLESDSDDPYNGRFKSDGENWNSEKIAEELSTSGINAGHALKFHNNGSVINGNNIGSWNIWTGDSSVYSGLVTNVLINNYPALSGNEKIFTNAASLDYVEDSVVYNESLAYLFNPLMDVENRAVFRNVTGLLQINEQGHYYYDSSQNFAEFNESTNSFTLYEDWGVKTGGSSPNGQFFPFNSMEEVVNLKSTESVINHYFGMTLTTRFIQQYSGWTNAKHTTQTTFNFAGDDDVWIYIDGILVADLGGIHDRSSVTINFATGQVVINEDSENALNLYDIYDAADKDVSDWPEVTVDGEVYHIYPDNSYHTLKFFYLERGNTDSNLRLEYNLHEIPETSIVKVDQYGNVVPGATFAVYPADKDYNIVLSPNSENKVPLEGNESYDLEKDSENYGSIISSDGEVLVHSLYTGTTDAKGEMVFLDEDSMPYSLAELKEMFGDQFMLKEIAVPDGYRMVNDEIKLRILNDQLLICDNTYESGIYTSPNLLVAAPGQIKLTGTVSEDLAKENYIDNTNGSYSLVDYYSEDDATNEVHQHGIVFAVVLKYVGPEEDKSAELRKQKNWVPVYGTNATGFTLETPKYNGDNDREAFIDAVIDAVKQYKESAPVFSFASASGQMQGSLSGMPGDVSKYYYVLGANEKEKTEYTIAYYWSSAGSLRDASSSNTYRVDADKETAGVSYSFSRIFGATIAVPNLNNRLFVQKFDEKGDLIDGAKFAMYEVVEEAEEAGNKIYYVGSSSDGARALIKLNADQTAEIKDGGSGTIENINSANGEITVAAGGQTYTIEAKNWADNNASVAVTKKNELTGESGTAQFTNMLNGTYYVREIEAPPGYEINPTEVMVLVDDTAVYANAGTVDDGITVARGSGYVVATLNQLASQGDIDNTLAWIYEMMRISPESNSFADADFSQRNKYLDWKYLTVNRNGSDLAENYDQGLRIYLEYQDQTESGNALFNYVLNKGRYGDDIKNVERRLYTDVGWSYYELYQDSRWALGYTDEKIGPHLKTGANYDLLVDEAGNQQEIANLFSRAVYIQVKDERLAGNLEISKTVINAPEESPSFDFTITLKDKNDKPLTDSYSYKVYENDDNGGRKPLKDKDGNPTTGTIDNGETTISLKDGQTAVIEGLPAGTQYTVTEAFDEAYAVTATNKVLEGNETYVFDLFTNETRTVSGTLFWQVVENDDGSVDVDTTSSVHFTNKYLPSIKIIKYHAGSPNTVLAGAEFQLSMKVENTDTKYYYTGNYTNNSSGWTANQKEAASLTSDVNGEITIQHLPDGTYSLEEIKAPQGYIKLSSSIEFTIENSSMTIIKDSSPNGVTTSGQDELVIMVPNSTGYELPLTGGTGTSSYIFGGLVLIGAALIIFLIRRKEVV